NEHSSNLYTEDDKTSPVTMKFTDFSSDEYISDHNESDDLYKLFFSFINKN
ncbi:472_t:CDS:1, partial [Cetraspora pellucida]